MYSPSIDRLIAALKKLPGVGVHTAERFVFHLLKSGKKDVGELTLAMRELISKTQSCRICWNFSDENPCSYCTDPKRETGTICIVAEPQDLMVIEKSRAYRGRYHVLRGILDATDEQSVEKLKIKELLGRLRLPAKHIVNEVILALNPTLAGETTMMYLEKEIRKLDPKLKISRLARGLPLGADIRYADEMTLESSIKNRN